jgi:hypothetical protein
MNVTEDMQTELELFDTSEQVVTSDRAAQERPVALSPWWTVCYQDIRVGRNERPPGLDRRSARKIEGHISKGGLPGTAIKLDSLDCHALILQIDTIRQTSFTGLGLSFEAGIMIAGNNEFDGVGQGSPKLIEVDNLIHATMTGHITRMNQHIPIWYFKPRTNAVRITDSHNSQLHECSNHIQLKPLLG